MWHNIYRSVFAQTGDIARQAHFFAQDSDDIWRKGAVDDGEVGFLAAAAPHRVVYVGVVVVVAAGVEAGGFKLHVMSVGEPCNWIAGK